MLNKLKRITLLHKNEDADVTACASIFISLCTHIYIYIYEHTVFI